MYDPVQYFDEMNLLREDKNSRTATAGKLFDAMLNFFKAQLLNLISGTFLFEKSSAEYRNELMDIYFSMMPDKESQYDTAVREKAYRFSQYIEEATERAIAKADGNSRYKDSRNIGLSMHEEDIPQSVLRMFSVERANEVALNETNWIYNYLNHLKLTQTQQTHTWVSTRDEAVRLSHWQADSQTVPINEPFIVGGYKMMFPLDDSFGAPIKEIINCRCVEL